VTVLSAQSIRRLGIFQPFHGRSTFAGLSFGLGPAGYDVRVAESIELQPGGFALASIMEHMTMPIDVVGFVHDKSTWARLGLAVQNTVIEPGWNGFLTVELTNHGDRALALRAGMPIAQIVFQRLDEPTELPYHGKYQHQEAGPQPARFA
jgi:dCTP deaminase